MSDMTVNTLNVDLIQDQATVGLGKPPHTEGGRLSFTSVTVSVPLGLQSAQPEHELRRHAIEEAKRVLREAIQALEAQPA